MPTSIHRKVRLAEQGEYPYAVLKLKSGWVMLAESAPVRGYCLLMSNPVVPDLNSLSEVDRAQYCKDMICIGDALLKVTDAYRINYETWGNLDPALHTHIVPRYRHEPDDKRVLPVCRAYSASENRVDDTQDRQQLIEALRQFLLSSPVG